MGTENNSSVGVSESSESKLAYETLQSRIVKASKEEPAPMNTDVVHASQVMLTSAINARPYHSELERIGSGEALELEPRALALSYANGLVKWSQDELEPLTDKAAEVTSARKELLSALSLLSSRGVLDASSVKVQSTTSYLGMADDVRAIATALLARWDEVGSHIGGDRTRVERGLVVADKLTRAVAESEALKEKAATAAAMRAGAWTLALEAYRELERGMAYLRYHEGDAEQVVPRIFNHGGGKPKRAEPEEPVLASPEQPVVVNANGQAANGQAANMPPAPMAPSKPFEQ